MSESDSTETETHQWLPVCALSDLDKNGRTVLRVERQRPGPPTPASTPSLVYERIFIAKGICSQAKTKEWDGGVYAITAVCPHAGAPLQAGTILDVTDLEDMVADPDRKKSWGKLSGTGKEFAVVCAAHGIDFNMLTGESLNNQSLPPAKTWKARISNAPTPSKGAAAGLRYENVPCVELWIEKDWRPTDMAIAAL